MKLKNNWQAQKGILKHFNDTQLYNYSDFISKYPDGDELDVLTIIHRKIGEDKVRIFVVGNKEEIQKEFPGEL